ncbi:hypothetical protein IQ238_29810 [Pleurocapsales cyanobacterium LEGE 06147]|nr:hypothetical protein [Pleurocapsales cyanobacterium LEGE 06147]
MTGQALDRSSTGVLILILPIAFAVVILYKLWPLLLVLAVLIIAWKTWQNYQWQQWSKQVNPYFNQLIKENRGYLTPVDLSLKANLTAKAANLFLERKADEYGVSPQFLKDKNVVYYYFPTASALGSILDASEPSQELEEEDNDDLLDPISRIASTSSTAKEPSKFSFRGLAQLARQEQEKGDTDTQTPSEKSDAAGRDKLESSESAEVEEKSLTEDSATEKSSSEESALIQAELAKRLDLNSSTVGRRKSDPDFPEWSKSKDPEGIAWKYEPETKMFVPVDAG